MEKVLKTVNDDQKDVRKAEWTNKEVSLAIDRPFYDEKEQLLDNPAR